MTARNLIISGSLSSTKHLCFSHPYHWAWERQGGRVPVGWIMSSWRTTEMLHPVGGSTPSTGVHGGPYTWRGVSTNGVQQKWLVLLCRIYRHHEPPFNHPCWRGWVLVPAGVTCIRLPTPTRSRVSRWSVPKDLANAKPLYWEKSQHTALENYWTRSQ